jgi:hemerythrin
MKMVEKVWAYLLIIWFVFLIMTCVNDVLQERIRETDKYARTALMFAKEDKINAEHKVELANYRIKLKEQRAKERKEIYEITVGVFRYGYFQGAKASGNEKTKEELYKEAEKWIKPYVAEVE